MQPCSIVLALHRRLLEYQRDITSFRPHLEFAGSTTERDEIEDDLLVHVSDCAACAASMLLIATYDFLRGLDTGSISIEEVDTWIALIK